jgi:hypothetical protein
VDKKAADLDLVLRGAHIGVPASDFQAQHAHIRAVAPDRDQKSTAFEEQFDADPLLGLWCLANYGFRDGTLYEYSLLWYDKLEKATAQRERFLRACIARHGRQYRRDAMKVDPGTAGERLAPVLVWTEEDNVYLASFAEHREKKDDPRGSFHYAVFRADDPFLEKTLAGKTLQPKELDQIHAESDALLQALAKEKPAKKPKH